MPSGSYSVLIKNKISEFNKVIKVDSDKSISIRSFLIGAISNDISEIKNPLDSDDVRSCIRCLKKLGVKIKRNKNKSFLVFGKGLGSLYAKKNTILDCGNSGTLARLLIGILSTTPNICVIVKGDKSLNKRDMSKLIKPMKEFGAHFFPENKKNFPLKLISSEMPIGIRYQSGNSAQIKSAVIFAALNSFGNTSISEKLKTRNHTENILLKNSQVLNFEKNNSIKIYGKKFLNKINLKIPADPSSSAFFAAMCLLNKKSKLQIKNICLNPRRVGFYDILKKHGAKIKILNKKKENNEIVGNVTIQSSKIRALKAKPKYYLTATDEYPIMFVIAALTNGVSKFNGISELANKESNRILEMKKILNKIGIRSKSTKNSITIFGKKSISKKKSIIVVDSKNDHRIAMSCAILSLNSGVKFLIKGFETVKTSSPSFLNIIKKLGGKFEIKKTT